MVDASSSATRGPGAIPVPAEPAESPAPPASPHGQAPRSPPAPAACFSGFALAMGALAGDFGFGRSPRLAAPGSPAVPEPPQGHRLGHLVYSPDKGYV